MSKTPLEKFNEDAEKLKQRIIEETGNQPQKGDDGCVYIYDSDKVIYKEKPGDFVEGYYRLNQELRMKDDEYHKIIHWTDSITTKEILYSNGIKRTFDQNDVLRAETIGNITKKFDEDSKFIGTREIDAEGNRIEKDTDGNILSIEDKDGNIKYFENNQLVAEELPNRVTREYQPDTNGEPQLVHEYQENDKITSWGYRESGVVKLKEKQWVIDSDNNRQLIWDVERDESNHPTKEQKWELDSKNQRRLVYSFELGEDNYRESLQKWDLTTDDKLILREKIDFDHNEQRWDEKGILVWEDRAVGYSTITYRYERVNDCEFLRDPEDRKNNKRCFQFKYKDITFEEFDSTEPGTAYSYIISQNGITFDGYPKEKSLIHTDEQGVERKLCLTEEARDVFGHLAHISSLARSHISSTDAETLDKHGLFRKEFEKYPDGTYYEWDTNGRIIKEDLPNGTSTTWEYIGEDTYKSVTKGNETLKYKNDEYTGKIVIEGQKSSVYDANDRIVTEEENGIKKTYYKNGNIKTKEDNGVTVTHYDPNDNEREIAYEHMGQLFVFNKKFAAEMNKDYKEAIRKGNMQEAKSCLLKMCMALNYFEPRKYNTSCSMLVKNELQKYQIKDLGDGKVAFGAIFEDRHWVKETFRGNGIEWYWKGAAAIIDVENCGLVASCETANERVRHPTDSKYDLWNKLDSEFITIDEKNGKLTVGLKADKKNGGEYYTKASIDYKEKIVEYDEKMLELRISNKLQELKDKTHTDNIEDIPHAKTQVLRELAKDNLGKPKRSNADKQIIKSALDKATKNTRS